MCLAGSGLSCVRALVLPEAEATPVLSVRRCARGLWASAWSTTTCGRSLSATTTSRSRRGWAGGNTARLEPRVCRGLPGAPWGCVGPAPPRAVPPAALHSALPHRDADQDLDGSDPDGAGRPRSSPPLPPAADGLASEQDPLARMHTGESAGGCLLLGEPTAHEWPDLGPRG